MTREEIQQAAELLYPLDNPRKNMHHDNLGQLSRRQAFLNGAVWIREYTEFENAALKQQVRELELSNLDKVNAELQLLTTKAENTDTTARN